MTGSSGMTARLTLPPAGSLQRWPDRINLVLWLIAPLQADTAVMHLAVNTRAITTTHVAPGERVQPLQTAPQMDADRNTGAAWWASSSTTNHSSTTRNYSHRNTFIHTHTHLWDTHGKSSENRTFLIGRVNTEVWRCVFKLHFIFGLM